MSWQIVGAVDAAAWRAALDRFPQVDVYFQPGYHCAYERNGDGQALAFHYMYGGEALFYPFLRRPIGEVAGERVPDAWCDIETVYGYSGPLATSAEPAFLDAAWSAFGAWCRDERVVAEFIRFSPLLANHVYAGATCQVTEDRSTVVVPLAGSAQDLWQGYPSVQRNMVRKAQDRGLVAGEVSLAVGLADFRRLYHATMDRNAAGAYYYFGDAYFDDLAGSLGDALRLFVVRDGPALAAAALFFVYPPYLHYHLAASAGEYRAAAPNNLLLHYAATWGQAHGLRWLHLGGGRTPDPADPLYRFKASVGRARLAFHIGRRVHDPQTYAMLCETWLRRTARAERPRYFLLYRLGRTM